MSTISAIGVSAFRAADMRLQAAASNIANAQTVGSLPGGPGGGDVYQPVDVVQVDGGAGNGVVTSYARRNDFQTVAQPNSPFANADGLVAAPNVDIATELVNVALARLAYGAAAAVVRAGQQMEREAVNKLA